MFTEDIVIRYGGDNRFSDQQTIMMARAFIVGIVAVTFLISTVSPAGVFAMAIWCFSGFSALVPLVLAALYWRRLTKAAAYASVTVTAVAWVYCFWQSDFAGKPYSVFGMLPVATMVAASTVTLVAVSLVTKPPSDETLARFFTERL